MAGPWSYNSLSTLDFQLSPLHQALPWATPEDHAELHWVIGFHPGWNKRTQGNSGSRQPSRLHWCLPAGDRESEITVNERRVLIYPRSFSKLMVLFHVEQQKSNEGSTFHEENMVMSAADLFLAGTDTTSTTIRWGFIFLIQNPDVQGALAKI